MDSSSFQFTQELIAPAIPETTPHIPAMNIFQFTQELIAPAIALFLSVSTKALPEASCESLGLGCVWIFPDNDKIRQIVFPK